MVFNRSSRKKLKKSLDFRIIVYYNIYIKIGNKRKLRGKGYDKDKV